MKQFYGVKAHLRFKDTSGKEIGHGFSGVLWLGTKNDLRNIKTDESACVLLFLMPVDRADASLFVLWKERKQISLGSETIQDRDVQLSATPTKVEVRLVDANHDLLMPPVDIDLSSITGTVKPESGHSG